MHIREFDWRIEPLHDIIIGIDAAIEAVRGRLYAAEIDGLGALDDVEPILGLGFVAFQTYALGTWTDLNEIRENGGKSPLKKLQCYRCDPVTVRGAATRIEVINAVANYFKHHDEWPRWPTAKKDQGFQDAETMRHVGISETADHPCIEATNLLCGTSWELIVLHQIVQEWRAHVITTLV